MKNLRFAPFFLLLSYLILCFFRSPQSSDSIIILGLCGLFGYQLFMEFNPKDSIEAQLQKQKEEILAELNKKELEAIKREEVLKLDIFGVNENVTKLSMNLLNTTKMKAAPNGQPEPKRTVLF